MRYTSQTGLSVDAMDRSPSTAAASQQDKRIVFEQVPNVVFTVGNGVAHDNAFDGKTPEMEKRELSAEEEDRFYKKVFKTSLL